MKLDADSSLRIESPSDVQTVNAGQKRHRLKQRTKHSPSKHDRRLKHGPTTSQAKPQAVKYKVDRDVGLNVLDSSRQYH